ncbi:cancer-related nucleoside-triphosphatase isoform X2 [Pteropus alecto]|uniref:cancer-related nucleoside-triphosphatase isoform X2 n=1 Tax=Pteropus alecto TaxID=9402 RepID=UPI000D53B505|nr:cancer-related nucleoside-triphosphatase isoform X2 [Pteropus alecto]
MLSVPHCVSLAPSVFPDFQLSHCDPPWRALSGHRSPLCLYTGQVWRPFPSLWSSLQPMLDGRVGKTTLIQKASAALQSSGVPVAGFYTEEVRQGGRRIGFDVVTLSGLRGPLSRVGPEPPPGGRGCRVGQYVVDLTSFEQLALPALSDLVTWTHRLPVHRWMGIWIASTLGLL